MAEGEIKITITGNVGEKDLGAGAGQTPQAQTPTKPSGDNAKNAAFFALGTFVVGKLKQIGARSISNIGNLTGDYILQSQVNTLVEGVGFVGGFAVAAATGPVGIAAFIATTAVNEGLRQYEVAVAREKGKIDKEYLMAKNGQVLRDNSRGGF